MSVYNSVEYVYLAMPRLTHLYLALVLIVYRDIKERIYSLRNKSKHKNRDAPKRPHILPVSRDVEIPPYEKAISRGVTQIAHKPAITINTTFQQRRRKSKLRTKSQVNGLVENDVSLAHTPTPTQSEVP